MPKHKTSKTVKKRFKLTAHGKLKYSRAGRRHLLGGKSRKRKRHLRRQAILNKVEHKRIVNLL
jgi:large subunit ribosomal protein L35